MATVHMQLARQRSDVAWVRHCHSPAGGMVECWKVSLYSLSKLYCFFSFLENVVSWFMRTVLTKIHDTPKRLYGAKCKSMHECNIATTLDAPNILRLLRFFGVTSPQVSLPYQPGHHPTSLGSRPGDTAMQKGLRMSKCLLVPSQSYNPSIIPIIQSYNHPIFGGGILPQSSQSSFSPADRSVGAPAPWPHRPRSWLQFSPTRPVDGQVGLNRRLPRDAGKPCLQNMICWCV